MIVNDRGFNEAQIIELLRIVNQLSQGIDPTSGLNFSDDTILNSEVIKSCLCDVVLLIERVAYLEQNKKGHHRGDPKVPFFLTIKQRDQIMISKEPISISKFVYEINGVSKSPTMAQLKATAITTWLMMHGFLKKIDLSDGTDCKIATDQGTNIGIITEKKKNTNDVDYYVNYYNEKAQKFIVDNVLNELDPGKS